MMRTTDRANNGSLPLIGLPQYEEYHSHYNQPQQTQQAHSSSQSQAYAKAREAQPALLQVQPHPGQPTATSSSAAQWTQAPYGMHQQQQLQPQTQQQALPSLSVQLSQNTSSYYPYSYATPLYQYPTANNTIKTTSALQPTRDDIYYGNPYMKAESQPLQQQHQIQMIPAGYQDQNKAGMEYLKLPQKNHSPQSSSGGLPISPLTNDSSFSRPSPIFQLPSQSYQATKTIQLSDNAVSKAIKAAEAMVAKEVGHITRRRRRKADVTPKTDVIYDCQICGKIFNRPYNLKSHQKTHSTEKPFPCKFCNKPFARSHDRKRHEKLHEGEKRFRCGGILKDGTRWGCNRRFARADALGRHFRTETGWSCIEPLMMEAREAEARGETNTQQPHDMTELEISKFLQEKH